MTNLRTTLRLNLIWLLVACSGGKASSEAEPKAPAAEASDKAAAAPAQRPAAEAAEAKPSAPAAPAAAEGPAQAGGLTWQAEKPLSARPPTSRMRAAEYVVSGDAGDAELTVYYFGPGQGGSVQANLDRWIGQMKQPDGRDSKDVATIAERKVGALKVTTLDVSGTFDGGMPAMMGHKLEPKPDQRMLGAIVEGPQGPVFFKLVGPQPTVEHAEPAFRKLVESLEPAA